MLINNDVQSSPGRAPSAPSRRRREAAHRPCLDRGRRPRGVRRARPAKAPTREEVAQFRGLMQGKSQPAAGRDRQAAGARRAGHRAGWRDAEVRRRTGRVEHGRALPHADAARFRAGRRAGRETKPERAKQPASPPRETRTAEPERRDAAPNAAQSQNPDAQRTAGADRQRPATGAETPVPRDGAKSASSDGTAVDGKPRAGEHKRTADSGDAESAQTLARKAADGEAQVGAAARSAQQRWFRGRRRPGRGNGAGRPRQHADADADRDGVRADPAADPDRRAAAGRRRVGEPRSGAGRTGAEARPADAGQRSARRTRRAFARGAAARMQNDVLPGTDLWLTQTENGWQLRADVRSRDAYDTLLANQEELVQRFAEGSLGKLTIEPVFHA